MPRVYRTRVAPMGGHAGGKAGSDYVLIEVRSGEAVGLGEVSDVEPDWGTVDWGDVRGWLRTALSGKRISDRRWLIGDVDEALPPEWHRELRAAVLSAVEAALLDLDARTYGIPAYEMLGGLQHSALAVSWVAFIRDDGAIDEEIREKVDDGFRAFKLKVGTDHAADLARIEAVRDIAGRGAHIRVDASGEWTVEEAIEKLREMGEIGVAAVETPVRAAARSVAKNAPEQVNENADDVAAELAKVREAVPVRVIEHVSDFDDAFAHALIRRGGVDVFNVMPGQAGGVYRAQRLIHLAETAGLDVLIGSTVELSPGTALALHLGVASAGVTEACDLVGPGLLVGDVCVEPLSYDHGWLYAKSAPGLGVRLDEAKLEQFAVEEA